MILSLLGWLISILMGVMMILVFVRIIRWRKIVHTYLYITETVLEFTEICTRNQRAQAQQGSAEESLAEFDWYIMQLKTFRYKTSFWENGDQYWNSRNFTFIRALKKAWDESLISELQDPRKQLLIHNLMKLRHVRNINELCHYVNDNLVDA